MLQWPKERKKRAMHPHWDSEHVLRLLQFQLSLDPLYGPIEDWLVDEDLLQRFKTVLDEAALSLSVNDALGQVRSWLIAKSEEAGPMVQMDLLWEVLSALLVKQQAKDTAAVPPPPVSMTPGPPVSPLIAGDGPVSLVPEDKAAHLDKSPWGQAGPIDLVGGEGDAGQGEKGDKAFQWNVAPSQLNAWEGLLGDSEKEKEEAPLPTTLAQFSMLDNQSDLSVLEAPTSSLLFDDEPSPLVGQSEPEPLLPQSAQEPVAPLSPVPATHAPQTPVPPTEVPDMPELSIFDPLQGARGGDSPLSTMTALPSASSDPEHLVPASDLAPPSPDFSDSASAIPALDLDEIAPGMPISMMEPLHTHTPSGPKGTQALPVIGQVNPELFYSEESLPAASNMDITSAPEALAPPIPLLEEPAPMQGSHPLPMLGEEPAESRPFPEADAPMELAPMPIGTNTQMELDAAFGAAFDDPAVSSSPSSDHSPFSGGFAFSPEASQELELDGDGFAIAASPSLHPVTASSADLDVVVGATMLEEPPAPSLSAMQVERLPGLDEPAVPKPTPSVLAPLTLNKQTMTGSGPSTDNFYIKSNASDELASDAVPQTPEAEMRYVPIRMEQTGNLILSDELLEAFSDKGTPLSQQFVKIGIALLVLCALVGGLVFFLWR